MTQDFSKDFGPFEGITWLNCAHQGPLPRVAVKEVQEAILWKTALHHLNDEAFVEVPKRLKSALGRLIGAPSEEIILGNSASYGLHLLANGIRWRAGDEVLLIKGDFPADILPWLALEEIGVRVRLIEPRDHVLQADELESHITKSTRLLCVTWIHSFNGYAVDALRIGEVCRSKGITFVLNCSQALGTRPFNVSNVPVDAVISVGFKWLCGPYGTGFCWLRPELTESLDFNQAYWLAAMSAEDLMKEQTDIRVRSDLGARKYDVFGTANFFNFKPWAASVEYLLQQGIENIKSHNDKLVAQLIQGLNTSRYELLSQESERSTLVFISHKDPKLNADVHEALKKGGVYVAFRAGKLRFSPHLYNTDEDIDRALSILDFAG
jgi:selenocysteine lyase/cysteine desulfurase